MLASVGVKAWSGKEDTTLLSMADCHVISIKCFDSPPNMEQNPGFKDDQGGAYG